jgi:predicted metal-dependent phosphoesterase TrpH
VKLDTHVHTVYSGRSTIRPLDRFLKESYNTPEGVYRRAKARGMDLVAITDHDRIDGALTIADRPDVIVGSEDTGVFPNDSVRVHLGVLGVTEAQHAEIQRLRHNVAELLPYLREQRIFTSINHVASRINGEITATHIAGLIPWVDGVEIVNGSTLPSQNRTARALADAYGRTPIAGSDSHTERGIGRTWIEVDGARTRGEFLAGLRAGRVRVAGRQGNDFTMASDIFRVASAFYEENARRVFERPFDWRSHAMFLGATFALPCTALALTVALAHFVHEMRFNRDLLFDLVARPGRRDLVQALPEVA